MTANRKPNVFIGCSREAIPYARAVSSHLEYYAQVNPWYAGVFNANEYTMEALERELAANDFAIFIFWRTTLLLFAASFTSRRVTIPYLKWDCFGGDSDENEYFALSRIICPRGMT
jgi:hypothetical protein